MSFIVSLYAAVLFFLLTPAILLRLPPKGNKFTVAAVHALVFALIFHFTHKLVWRLGARLEGFTEGAAGSKHKKTVKSDDTENNEMPSDE